MMDFQHEEAGLSAAVGQSADEVLAEAGAEASSRLAAIRSRYLAYVGKASLSAAERLERDRLDSLVTELYGPRGLLAGAGALITLRDRLRRVGGLALGGRASSALTSRVRREALILRAFAREQVERKLGGTGAIVVAAAAALESTLSRFHAFCLEAEGIDRRVGNSRVGRVLVDAAHLVDDWPEQRSLGDAVAFTLHHLAESATLKSALGEYDGLCQAHAATLRDELWASAEVGFSRRALPATLEELSALDLTLEALCAKLTDPRVDGAERCSAIGELYATAGGARATEASTAAQAVLEPLLEILRTGISAEARG
ncbi:MAG: hypothetical protein ACYC8T_29410 [Myxococcaceae bacterium]